MKSSSEFFVISVATKPHNGDRSNTRDPSMASFASHRRFDDSRNAIAKRPGRKELAGRDNTNGNRTGAKKK